METPARELKGQSWRDAYQVAMCESDLDKLPGSIDDAEAALVKRARELFYDDAEEQESVHDAMCILHALRSSLKRRVQGVQRTSDVDYPGSA
jgi:hypothetical protein